MEFFGITMFGFPDIFAEMRKPGYHEPEKPSICIDLNSDKYKGKKLYECYRDLDAYLKNVDGYAYGSYDRMMRLREKGYWKPVAPCDMYKRPITQSQYLSYWMGDKMKGGVLESKEWMYPLKIYRRKLGPQTRFVQNALIQNKSLVLPLL